MAYVLTSLLFTLLPVAITVFFAVSIILWCVAKSANKKIPYKYSDEQIKTRKICLIVSSVLFGAMVIGIVSLVSLFMMAIAFM